MTSEAETKDLDGARVEHSWSERGVRPIILLYVVGVFVGFIASAHFVFRSGEAVEALVVAALASIAATVPGILKKTEYHLTIDGLSRRPLAQRQPRDFVEVFKWEELSHLVPTKAGFKYYKKLEEPSRLVRFLKVHFLSGYSGKFHVGPEVRNRVEPIVDRHAIPRQKPSKAIRSSR
jgi:hypothetical protein